MAPFTSGVTSPFDYVPASDAVYQARLTDIAKQIKNDLHSPDILMVQEVENQDVCSVAGDALDCGAALNNPDGSRTCSKNRPSRSPARAALATTRPSTRQLDQRGIIRPLCTAPTACSAAGIRQRPELGSAPTVDYTGFPVPNNSQVSNPKT